MISCNRHYLLVGLLCLMSLGCGSIAYGQEKTYYDYSKTAYIIIYTPDEEGGRWLSPPFRDGPPYTGRDFYKLILPYIASFEDAEIPLPEPSYTFDFTSENNMKRFFLGDGWVSDGEKVAFLSQKDWEGVEKIVRLRVDNIPPEKIGRNDIERSFSKKSENPEVASIDEDDETRSLQAAMEAVGARSVESDELESQDSIELANETTPVGEVLANESQTTAVGQGVKSSAGKPEVGQGIDFYSEEESKSESFPSSRPNDTKVDSGNVLANIMALLVVFIAGCLFYCYKKR